MMADLGSGCAASKDHRRGWAVSKPGVGRKRSWNGSSRLLYGMKRSSVECVVQGTVMDRRVGHAELAFGGQL